MDLIYTSASYCVLSYPAQQGFELFDKASFSSAYLDGPSAWHFRMAMEAIPQDERDIEHVDAFLEDYCASVCRPIVLH